MNHQGGEAGGTPGSTSQWQQFQSQMRKKGCCTNYAAQQFVIQDHNTNMLLTNPNSDCNNALFSKLRDATKDTQHGGGAWCARQDIISSTTTPNSIYNESTKHMLAASYSSQKATTSRNQDSKLVQNLQSPVSLSQLTAGRDSKLVRNTTRRKASSKQRITFDSKIVNRYEDRGLKASSSHFPTFADSKDEKETKDKEDDQDLHLDSRRNYMNPERYMQVFAQAPPIPARRPDKVEPLEIQTDDAIKTCDGARPEEILVDFPSLRRGASLSAIMCSQDDDSDEDDEQGDIGNSTRDRRASKRRPSTGNHTQNSMEIAACHRLPGLKGFFDATGCSNTNEKISGLTITASANLSEVAEDTEEEIFVKPTNWIEHDEEKNKEDDECFNAGKDIKNDAGETIPLDEIGAIEEMLVDFPSQPRRVPTFPATRPSNNDRALILGRGTRSNLTGGKLTETRFGFATLRQVLWHLSASSAKGYNFEREMNLVEPPPKSICNEHDGQLIPTTDVKEEEMLVDFPANPRQKIRKSLPQSVPSTIGKIIDYDSDSDLSDDDEEYLRPSTRTITRKRSTGDRNLARVSPLGLYRTHQDLLGPACNKTSAHLSVNPEKEFVRPSNWVNHDEDDSDDGEEEFVKPTNWVADHGEEDSSDEEIVMAANSVRRHEKENAAQQRSDFERPELTPYIVAMRQRIKELGQQQS